MRKSSLFVLALVLSAMVAGAQEADDPWESWQPPTIEIPDPNAFEIYEAAFALIDELGEPDRDGELEALSDHLESHRDTVRLLRTAMMGECQLPIVASFSTTMPYLAKFRGAARLLAARAKVMRAYGLHLESALDAVDIVRMAQDIPSQRTLISFLVGVACESIAYGELGQTVPHLTSSEARVVISALRDAQRDRTPFAVVMEGELMFSRTVLREHIEQFRERKDKADDATRIRLEEVLAFNPDAWNPEKSWEKLEVYHKKIIAMASEPTWQDHEAIVPGDPLLDTLAPAVEKALLKDFEVRAWAALNVTRLACHAYWVDEGAPPDTLDALVPDYLPAVPVDPFDGRSLRGPADAAGLVVYSVGADLKDGGGRIPDDVILEIQEPLTQ